MAFYPVTANYPSTKTRTQTRSAQERLREDFHRIQTAQAWLRETADALMASIQALVREEASIEISIREEEITDCDNKGRRQTHSAFAVTLPNQLTKTQRAKADACLMAIPALVYYDHTAAYFETNGQNSQTEAF